MTSAAQGREVLMTAQSESLEQLVNFPTHTKGNILDLVVTNCPDKIIAVSDGGRVGKSDHCILNIEINAKLERKKDKVTRSNWKKADIVGLKTFLQNRDWNHELGENLVEVAWSTFRTILDTALAKFVPESTVRDKSTPK